MTLSQLFISQDLVSIWCIGIDAHKSLGIQQSNDSRLISCLGTYVFFQFKKLICKHLNKQLQI
ncbi:unnamed protein product [Paramecium sonneborni]|uniref:Uncharacterized protein n=1 Tax=Paramecium sonneborni TaxID=65129 RepID=A0A8S1PB08_9CILI|nr:unnamed protein product [Paramecium sonneborni]